MLYDATGIEIPGAMTAEEVQAKVGEATTAAKAEAETARQALETDLTAAKELLEKTTTQMAGMSDKEKNEARASQIVRQQEKLIKDLEAKIDSVKTEVMGTVTARTRETVIKSLADGDSELEAKIQIQYDRLIKLEPTVDDITIAKVATDAYKLAAESVKPSVLNRVISSKPTGSIPRSDSSVDPQLTEAGAAFGLSEEDIKKYRK
jgi:hypothetical protein